MVQPGIELPGGIAASSPPDVIGSQ
ncbi:MAG: hypothetical protein QOI80_340, partial [Solirubrobacteraceae bacterium]|nr:hypothetical protein [Solirubrobacteraceae bacterium]